MKVWQIATGETGRDYSEIFFDYDIMILGPSHLGDATKNSYPEHRKVNNFALKPRPGDRVLMRFGKNILGLGEIPSNKENPYFFDETYECVYGWDLCHRRRIIWTEEDYDLGKLATVYKEGTVKPAFNQVHEKRIVEMVRNFDGSVFDRPLKELPTIDYSKYKEEDLGIELFSAGISNKNIDDIIKALQQAERLELWYLSKQCGRRPTENEIVSHMILPVFLGLGWSHQQIAVEWHKVDLAFFKTTPTTPDNCVMVLEAKGFGRGLGDTVYQPMKYVKNLGLKNVRYILTTDGSNLFVYEKDKKKWKPDNPVAYLSIRSLQREYVLPKNTDAIDTLVRLQPSAV